MTTRYKQQFILLKSISVLILVLFSCSNEKNQNYEDPILNPSFSFLQDVNIKNNDNRTPLHYASSQGNSTLLHWASRRGKLQVVQHLIGKKADPKLKDNFGRTAYDWAIERKKSAVADYLRQFN